MSGWLPIEIVLGRYPSLVWPGVVPETTVRWMQFGCKRLNEPFFSQSVAQLRESDHPALEIETDVTSLVREGSRTPRLLPNGFIFHVSRCGSTLISNALKLVDRIQVVAEARPITRLFMPCPPVEGDAFIDPGQDEERRKLTECLFSLFSCYRTGKPEPIVVKFMSQNSISFSTIHGLWPDVPCLFVIRDPVDVMVSNLKDGGLNRFTESPALAYAMCGADPSLPISQISVEEFCARVLGRYFDALIGKVGPNVRIIDYDDINPESICDIIKFFHLDPSADLACMDSVFQRYSKDPTGNTPFHGDRLEKREGASARIRNAANLWALPRYSKLRFASGRGQVV